MILFGVDHSFKSKGRALDIVKAEGEDENHFDPNYFANGVRWGIPDLDGSERDYQTAYEVFRANGRRIFDATIDGKLDVFPKIGLDEARKLCGLGDDRDAKGI